MDDFNMSQPIESNIHEACMNGETERFLNLINEAEHLDIVEIDKKRTLIFAVINKNLKMVHKLLDHGADINIQDEEIGATPLFHACCDGSIEIAVELMERGADVTLKTIQGEVPLLASVWNNRVDIIMKLLDYGANPNFPCLPTILHIACRYSDFEVVKALLKYGAKVTQIDFTYAITSAKIEMLQTLLNNVPDINQLETLFHAAFTEHIDVVKMLIKYEADVNRNVALYWPPLNTATRAGNMQTMSELLKNGANANLKDFIGNAPIHQASRSPRAMKVLLNEGGHLDSNMRNKNGETGFEIALTKGRKDTAKMMFHHSHNKF